MMSMATFSAAPLMAAPTRKVAPPRSIDHLRPNTRVTVEAKNEATSAARYSDDVKVVSSWLSYLQYLFVDLSSFTLRNTDGKNFLRKGSFDVTPPGH